MKAFGYEETVVIYNSLYSCLKIYRLGAESISFDAPIILHRMRMMVIDGDVNNTSNELFALPNKSVRAKCKNKCLGEKKTPLNNSADIVAPIELTPPAQD